MLFLPIGVEIELIFALQAAVSEIRADFQNCHIFCGHETWNLKQVLEIAYGSSSYPCGVEIELVFALWAAVSVIQTDLQNCHIWS